MGNTQCCQANSKQPQQKDKSEIDKIPIVIIDKMTELNDTSNRNESPSIPSQLQPQPISQPILSQYIQQNITKLNPFPENLSIGNNGNNSHNYKLHRYGTQIYKGEVNKNKQPHGFGTMHFKDGSVYVGEFAYGVAEGDSYYFLKDGSYYKGKMKQNKANDMLGEYYNADIYNKFHYNGEIKDNQFKGYGILKAEDYIFEGFFQNNKITTGKLSWNQHQQGSLIKVGEDNNKSNDKDKEKDKSNEKEKVKEGSKKNEQNNEYNWSYEGRFNQQGKFQGKGTLKCPKGQFEGNYRNGVKQGHGIFSYKSGVRYQGNYKKDKRQGKGTMYSRKNQISYQGQFINGMPNGKGYVLNKSGKKVQMIFKDGISSHVDGE